MTINAQTPADRHVPAAPRRRLGWVVAVLLLLLLLLGGAGVWWVVHHPSGRGGGDASHTNEAPPDAAPGPLCSDDDDPKYLEHLEFGPPVETSFDRGRLDALPARPIPEVEQYPWQPPELVAVLGEHRMRGQLIAASPDGTTLAVGSPGDGFLRIGPTETVHEKVVLTCPGGVQALAWAAGRGRSGRQLRRRRGAAVSTCATSTRSPTRSRWTRWPGWSRTYRTPPTASTSSAATTRRNSASPGCGTWTRARSSTSCKHSGPVMGVAFSPTPGDYRALTGGGPEDGQLHLWADAVKGDDQTTIEFRG